VEERFKKAFNSGRCIICHLLREDEFDILCQWVGNRQEEEFQKILLGRGGFCNYHLWTLEKLCDPLGTAYLTKALLDQFICEADENRIDEFKNYTKKQYNLSEKNKCPVCDGIAGCEAKHLKNLKEFLRSEQNLELYQKSRGLCIIHFIKLFDFLEDTRLKEKIFSIQKQHIEILLRELEGFIRKQRRTLRWQRTDDEKRAYMRALEKLVATRGVKWLKNERIEDNL
jgi:hypothetical protein